VHVYHFGSTSRLTPEVTRLIQALHGRGFQVEGRLYDRSAFEERARAFVDAEPGSVVVAAGSPPPEAVRRRTVAERTRALVGRVARGMSVLAFPFRPSKKLEQVRTRALLAGNTLLGLRLFAQGEFFYGLPSVVLSAWIYAYVSNAKELYRFKSQCVSVRVDDEGNLSLDPNYAMLAAGTFVEELALTSLLRMSVGGTDAVAGDPTGVAGDAAFAAFAKTATERPVADLYARAHRALERGDVEAATQLERRAERYQDVFYNLLFPALKFLQLPVPTTDPTLGAVALAARTLSNAALVAIGTYGIVREAGRAWRSRPQADATCATLLDFAGRHALAK
jgi:hypothetical protein